MTYKEIIYLSEQLGWSVDEEIEDTRHLFEFSQMSPAGEDFLFYVDGETPHSLIHEVFVYAENFDEDEHISMWLQAKDSEVQGVPSARELVDDAKAIQDMLNELSDVLSAAEKVKDLNYAYAESDVNPLEFHYWCNSLGEINPLDDPSRVGKITDLPDEVREIYENYCCDRGGVNNYVVTAEQTPGIALRWLFTPEDKDIPIGKILEVGAAMVQDIPYGIVYMGDVTDPDGHELLLFVPKEFIDVFYEHIRKFQFGEGKFGDRYYDLVYGSNHKSKSDECEDVWFAKICWRADDAIGAAAEHGIVLTKDQAVQWWTANQTWFKDRLTEAGNEMLSSVEWDEVKFCSQCGRLIQTDEVSYEHNFGIHRLLQEGVRGNIVCSACHDTMWENGEISRCENCGNWYNNSLLKSDPEPVGGDTFTPCPHCGCDIVDGMTREERVKEHQPTGSFIAPQYAVTFKYSFDDNVATYLFSKEQEAKKFLRDNYDCEVKSDTEENHYDTTHEISDDGWKAKIINHFQDHDDITEMFISQIYQ